MRRFSTLKQVTELVKRVLKFAFKSNSNRGVYIYARACARVGAVVAIVIILFSVANVSAITSQYSTAETDLKPGMTVALSVKQPLPTDTVDNTKPVAYVEKSSKTRANQTIGVVVSLDQNTLNVVGGSSSSGLVYVANSGEVKVYVTDLNGTPQAGDLLSPSPLKGVLMKASDGATGIMGSLLSDFPKAKAETVTVEGSAKTSVKVAVVTINMDVRTSSKSSGTLGLLQRIGQNIVGHTVSPAQVFVALTVLALVIVVEGGILYATISSYITSLGRNPLASKKLFSGLMQVAGLVAVVLAVGGVAIYLVLRI